MDTSGRRGSCRAPKEIVPVTEVLDEDQMKTETWIFLSLMSALSSPDDSLKWCAKHRLIKNTNECNRCKKPSSFVSYQKGIDKRRWCCRACNVSQTVRLGSFFVRSNLRLDQILALVYFWANDMPQTVIIRELQLSSQTVVDWCNFCRDECECFVKRNILQIGGLDENGKAIFVEIDESKYLRQKYYDSNDDEGTWLLGGIERGSGKCFLVEVPDRTAATLQAEIVKYILPGSHIVSYEWAAYANIDCIECGIYRHSVIDKHDFVNPNNRDIHLQTIKNMWARLNRKLNGQFGTSRTLLPSYLYEFVFRNAFRGQDIFSNFISCIAQNYDV